MGMLSATDGNHAAVPTGIFSESMIGDIPQNSAQVFHKSCG
jgi:hypothetical protein